MELTKALLECCGAGWDMVERVEDRKGHDRRYSLDDSLLRGMGYSPQIKFSDGLEETVRWYQENRRWWEPLKEPQPGDRNEAATSFATPIRRRLSSRLRKTR